MMIQPIPKVVMMLRGTIPVPERRALEDELKAHAESAVRSGELYGALMAYCALDDRHRVREIGERCLQEGKWLDARTAYAYLQDADGLFRTAQIAESDVGPDSYAVENTLLQYINLRLGDGIHQAYERWLATRGCRPKSDFRLGVINMAGQFRADYDLGIGVAMAGLFGAFAGELFGLPAIIADCHRRGKTGTKFRWQGTISREMIDQKRIVVFDNDVVSGRTSRRVLEEVKKHDPAYVDLALFNSPTNGGIGTIVHNIPSGYRKTFFAKDFSYQHFDKVVDRLEAQLQTQSA